MTKSIDRSKTALVVDDEESIRHLVSFQLKRLGYECATATDGLEALAQLSRREFGLVMLDIRMPRLSGLEVLKEIRLGRTATCVVMMSALADAEIAVAALKLGADDYLTKPCGPDHLKLRLEGAHKHRELEIERQAEGSTVEKPPQDEINLIEVTEDLIHQQLALVEGLGPLEPPEDRPS